MTYGEQTRRLIGVHQGEKKCPRGGGRASDHGEHCALTDLQSKRKKTRKTHKRKIERNHIINYTVKIIS